MYNDLMCEHTFSDGELRRVGSVEAVYTVDPRQSRLQRARLMSPRRRAPVARAAHEHARTTHHCARYS